MSRKPIKGFLDVNDDREFDACASSLRIFLSQVEF
jgi:hypothetical protein